MYHSGHASAAVVLIWSVLCHPVLFVVQGGPSEELSGVVGLLDGWIEGPTWAGPLNNRQLTALLLVLHAARK